MSEHKEMQRHPRISFTPEYSTIITTVYSQASSTPSTVQSVPREQVDRDSSSANMASMKPTHNGYLTSEQQRARDAHNESLHRSLFEIYMTSHRERDTRASVTSAMTAKTVPL